MVTPAARGQEPADHVIEGVGRRQVRGIDVQAGREFLGQPVIQQPRTMFSRDLQQLGPDDRNAPALLDEAQQVIPGIVVECADRHASR